MWCLSDEMQFYLSIYRGPTDSCRQPSTRLPADINKRLFFAVLILFFPNPFLRLSVNSEFVAEWPSEYVFRQLPEAGDRAPLGIHDLY
jgi:hypothetical protein